MVVAFHFRVQVLSHDTIEHGVMWKRIRLCPYEFDIQIGMYIQIKI